jgi:hypothetical protein
MYLVTILEVWGTGCHSSPGYVFFEYFFKLSHQLPNLIPELGKQLPKPCRSTFLSSAGLPLVKQQ